MKALVLGGGGREHALAWKLAQSPLVQTVYVAPGNGGTATDKRLENIAITDVVALREWAQDHQIDITVVGPEGLLAAGVVDEFRAHGLRIFGPTQAAAQLESSKAFSKDLKELRFLISLRGFNFFVPFSRSEMDASKRIMPLNISASDASTAIRILRNS